MEQVLQELKKGKKVYLGELLSLIVLLVFISFADRIPFLKENYVASRGVLIWMVINLIVIATYTIYDFAGIVVKGEKLSKEGLLALLVKMGLFSFFFLSNSIAIAPSNNLPVTLTILIATELIVFSARKTQQGKMLVIIGVLWMVFFFFALGTIYQVGTILLQNLIGNAQVAGFIMGIVYLAFSFLCIRKILPTIRKN